MVEADAEQVEVRTDRLELWFRSLAGPATAGPAPTYGAFQMEEGLGLPPT